MPSTLTRITGNLLPQNLRDKEMKSMNTRIETIKLKLSDVLYISKKLKHIFNTVDDSIPEAMKKMLGTRNLTALHNS